jgi:hypothetical protein
LASCTLSSAFSIFLADDWQLLIIIPVANIVTARIEIAFFIRK